MNLQEIREQFVKASGRYDLVKAEYDEAYVDNGADHFIRAGQKFLDDRVHTPGSRAVYTAATVVGGTIVAIPDVKALEEVWIEQNGLVTPLELVYPVMEGSPVYSSFFNTSSQGPPRYYALAPQDYTARNVISQRIRLYPAPDLVYVLRASGQFYASNLSVGTDTNWWSLAYPQLLIRSSLLQLESFYGNSSAINDRLALLEEELRNVDLMTIEMEIGGQYNSLEINRSW